MSSCIYLKIILTKICKNPNTIWVYPKGPLDKWSGIRHNSSPGIPRKSTFGLNTNGQWRVYIDASISCATVPVRLYLTKLKGVNIDKKKTSRSITRSSVVRTEDNGQKCLIISFLYFRFQWIWIFQNLEIAVLFPTSVENYLRRCVNVTFYIELSG